MPDPTPLRLFSTQSRSDQPHPYQVLGLEEGEADPGTIEAAYRAAAARLKSYRGQVDEASWREAARRVKQAWGVLSDPEQKRELDARFGIFADPIVEDPLEGLLPAADPLAGSIRLHGPDSSSPVDAARSGGAGQESIAAVVPGVPTGVRPEPATGVSVDALFGSVGSTAPTVSGSPVVSAARVVSASPVARRRRRRSKLGATVLTGTILALVGFVAALGYFLIFGQGRVEIARGGGQVTIRTSPDNEPGSRPVASSPPRRDESPEPDPAPPDPVMGRLGQGNAPRSPVDRDSPAARRLDIRTGTEPDSIRTGTEPDSTDIRTGTEPDSTGTDSTDSTGTVPDSTGTVPDSTGTVPDSTVPDSTGTVPDMTGTVPDSMGTVPDSMGTVPDMTDEPGEDAGSSEMAMSRESDETEKPGENGENGSDMATEVVARGESAFARAAERFASADWGEMNEAVKEASRGAATSAQRRDAQDLAELVRHATRYREGLRRAMGGLGGGNELKLGPLDVIVVEASSDELTIRRGAKNRTYGIDELPPIVANALSDLTMPPDDPATKVGRWVYQSIAPTFDVAYRDEAVAGLRGLKPDELSGSTFEGTEPSRLADLIEQIFEP